MIKLFTLLCLSVAVFWHADCAGGFAYASPPPVVIGGGVPTSAPSYTSAEAKHEQMLYPTVRVRAPGSAGSGTILYSEDRSTPGDYESFIITNHHVVESAIRVEKRWSNLYQRYEDAEVLDEVTVELFRYTSESRENGKVQYTASIMAYSPDEDLALLQVNTTARLDHVAAILPAAEPAPRIFEDVYAVGCSLAQSPVPTRGQVTSVSVMIDRRPYYMISAPVIFGNSGGAVYLERGGRHYWVGVPSRLAVAQGAPVPHMAYAVPLARVRAWLESQQLTFFFAPAAKPADCFTAREALRRGPGR